MNLYHCVVPLPPASMKNSRRIMHGRPIKSTAAIDYINAAVPVMRLAADRLPMFPPKTPLTALVVARYPDLRRDLDVEIVYDCLQRAGVISNDRQIWKKHAYRQTASPEAPAQTEILLWISPTTETTENQP